MSASLSTVAYLYKVKYTPEKIANLASKDRVFLSHLTKVGGFSGEELRQGLMYGNTQGVSDSLADAVTATSSTKGVQWTHDRARKMGRVLIDAESMLAADGDQGSFARLVMNETESAIDAMGHEIGLMLYGDSTGKIGRRSSASTNVITLTTARDAHNFEVGMTVQAGTISGITVTLRTGSTTVTGVDVSSGTITLASAAAISSFADNDYLFRYGTANTAGTYTKIVGLQSWLPATAPVYGADSFLGVDRGANVTRLAGHRISGSADIEEKILDAATEASIEGSKARHFYMHPVKWTTLVKQLGSKVEREESGSASFGFDYVTVAGATGQIRVYPDPLCPFATGFLIDHRAWKLRYLGPSWVHLVTDDGLTATRGLDTGSANAGDSLVKRFRFLGNLTCAAPAWNATVAL